MSGIDVNQHIPFPSVATVMFGTKMNRSIVRKQQSLRKNPQQDQCPDIPGRFLREELLASNPTYQTGMLFLNVSETGCRTDLSNM